jgi:hypothetical protein
MKLNKNGGINGTCNTTGVDINAHKILAIKSQRKRALGSSDIGKTILLKWILEKKTYRMRM